MDINVTLDSLSKSRLFSINVHISYGVVQLQTMLSLKIDHEREELFINKT